MTSQLGLTRDVPQFPEELRNKVVSCSNCGWFPNHLDGYLWPSMGEQACNWIERNLILGEGDYFGKLIKLREDQARFIYCWYEYCGNCNFWHYDRALRMAATGDGKTQFIATPIMVDFAGPPDIATKSPNIPVAAASWEQADLIFKAVSIMCGGAKDSQVPESPLFGHFNVLDSEITFKDGRPGRIFRTAAVAGTNEGGLPSLFVGDEIHEWGALGETKARRHTVISKSTRKRNLSTISGIRRGPGRVLNISTAGFDKNNSMLGNMYLHAKRVEHEPSLDPKFLSDIYEAPDGLNYDDPADREIAVKAASKGAGTLWNIKDRVNAWNDPTMEHHEWIRYFANRWVDVAEDSWMKDHPQAWMNCSGAWEASNSNAFVLSVDMALKHDSVAVTRVEYLGDEDGRTAVTAKFWRANEHGGRIPHTDVWKYIKKQATGLGFKGVVYDPRYFEVPAKLLEEEGIQVIEFDQNPQRMAPACGMAYDKILAKMIVHDGNPDLWHHVNGACKAELERGGFTLRKGKSRGHIDGAIAMCMGVWALHAMDLSEYTVIEGSLMA